MSQRRHGKNGKWNKEVYLDINESLSDGQAHGWDYCLTKKIMHWIKKMLNLAFVKLIFFLFKNLFPSKREKWRYSVEK